MGTCFPSNLGNFKEKILIDVILLGEVNRFLSDHICSTEITRSFHSVDLIASVCRLDRLRVQTWQAPCVYFIRLRV